MPADGFQDFLKTGMEQRLAEGAVDQVAGRLEEGSVGFQGPVVDDQVGQLALQDLHPVPQAVHAGRLDVALAVKVDAQVKREGAELGFPGQHLPIVELGVFEKKTKIQVPLRVVIEIKHSHPDAQLPAVTGMVFGRENLVEAEP